MGLAFNEAFAQGMVLYDMKATLPEIDFRNTKGVETEHPANRCKSSLEEGLFGREDKRKQNGKRQFPDSPQVVHFLGLNDARKQSLLHVSIHNLLDVNANATPSPA